MKIEGHCFQRTIIYPKMKKTYCMKIKKKKKSCAKFYKIDHGVIAICPIEGFPKE